MLCIHRYEALPSTNDEGIRLAKEGAPEGTVVWAERQTAGRGRRGRTWESPEGNLYMSVILRPDLPLALAGRIGVACGMALREDLAQCAVEPLLAEVRTKWPNDLYLMGRKLGGILVETRAAPGGRLDWAVVGAGINAASHPDVSPPGQPATCLAEHGFTGDIGELVASLARRMTTASRRIATEAGWRVVADAWEKHDLAAGPIRILEGDREYEAEGIGLDGDGALLARTWEGVRRVTAGEVSIRSRAAG